MPDPARRPVGHPRRDPSARADQQITVRLTPADLAEVTRAAESRGMRLAVYVAESAVLRVRGVLP